MDIYDIPVSFYYTVDIANVGSSGDSSFSEVSGLGMERDVEEIMEGGENRFVHRLPGRAKFNNLVLKRGVLLLNSGLAQWCTTILEADMSQTMTANDIVVSLLNAKGQPALVWNIKNAWPVKWSVVDLVADRNELAIETLEFAYDYFTKAPGSGANAMLGNPKNDD
ncbi:MAG: phage tail protein [Burkholderiales bacterium]|nr:phage tail protein [Burkholderiales bacterium]